MVAFDKFIDDLLGRSYSSQQLFRRAFANEGRLNFSCVSAVHGNMDFQFPHLTFEYINCFMSDKTPVYYDVEEIYQLSAVKGHEYTCVAVQFRNCRTALQFKYSVDDKVNY